MTALILRGKSRHLINRVHRWSGLVMLVLLFITAVTGAVLAFRGEVDAWLNPQLFRVQPGAEPLPLAELIASVEARYAGLRVGTLGLQQRPDDSLRLFVRPEQELLNPTRRPPGSRAPGPFNQVFVDPYRGTILGTRHTADFAVDRVNLVPFLLRLHYSLFLEQWGVWLMGGCAAVWFISNWLGLALAWPREAGRLANWRALLGIRRQGSYKFNYDLHRVAGIVSLPVLVVVAFTSIYLNLPDLVKPAIAAFSPLNTAAAPDQGRVAPTDAMLAPEQAILSAMQSLPGSRPTFLQRDLNRGVYAVRLKQPGDVGHNGDHQVWVSLRDGRIVGSRLGAERSGGDTFIAWMRPLHGGTAFGLVGQTLVCLAALALIAMCISGLIVWLRKQRGERRQSGRRISPPAKNHSHS